MTKLETNKVMEETAREAVEQAKKQEGTLDIFVSEETK